MPGSGWTQAQDVSLTDVPTVQVHREGSLVSFVDRGTRSTYRSADICAQMVPGLKMLDEAGSGDAAVELRAVVTI